MTETTEQVINPIWMKTLEELGPDEGTDHVRLVDGGALSWTYGVFPISNWDTVKHSYRGAIVCLDSKTSWRRETIPGYKQRRADRRLTDPRVQEKKALVDRFREALAIDPTLSRCLLEGFEADDTVAIHYLQARAAGRRVKVYAVDKDLVQVPGLMECMYGFDNEKRDKTFSESLKRTPNFWPRCRNERDVLLGQLLFGDRSDSIERLLPRRATDIALNLYHSDTPFMDAHRLWGEKVITALYQLLIPCPRLHALWSQLRLAPGHLLYLVDEGLYWDADMFPHVCVEPVDGGW